MVIENYGPSSTNSETLSNFRLVSEEEVSKTISTMKMKSCELDALSATVLREVKDEIVPALTKLMNKSLHWNFC
jgi:hypothetical protein